MDDHDRTKCPNCENCITNLRDDKKRLEERNATLVTAMELDNTSIMLLQSKNERLEKENENLREALKSVVWLYEEGDDESEEVLRRAYSCASDALKERISELQSK